MSGSRVIKINYYTQKLYLWESTKISIKRHLNNSLNSLRTKLKWDFFMKCFFTHRHPLRIHIPCIKKVSSKKKSFEALQRTLLEKRVTRVLMREIPIKKCWVRRRRRVCDQTWNDEKFPTFRRRAIKWVSEREKKGKIGGAQYFFIDWRKGREKTPNVFYFMIISFIYGLFLLLLFCHTENFIFFLLLLVLLLNWVVFRKRKKNWINENKNKQR